MAYRISSVSYPSREPMVVIRQCYLDLCEGDHCAAALLNEFDYWHGVRMGDVEQEKIKASADPDYSPNMSLWIYKKIDGLQKDLMGLYGETKIAEKVKYLIGRKFLECRDSKNPFEKTKSYLFKPETVQLEIGDRNRKTTVRSRKTTASSITETTALETTENTPPTPSEPLPHESTEAQPELSREGVSVDDPGSGDPWEVFSNEDVWRGVLARHKGNPPKSWRAAVRGGDFTGYGALHEAIEGALRMLQSNSPAAVSSFAKRPGWGREAERKRFRDRDAPAKSPAWTEDDPHDPAFMEYLAQFDPEGYSTPAEKAQAEVAWGALGMQKQLRVMAVIPAYRESTSDAPRYRKRVHNFITDGVYEATPRPKSKAEEDDSGLSAVLKARREGRI